MRKNAVFIYHYVSAIFGPLLAEQCIGFFYVLLTVHLSIILGNDQLDTQLLYFILQYVYYNPYPTAFPYGNGMVLHFYQQQESSTTKTVHKVINKGLKTYV